MKFKMMASCKEVSKLMSKQLDRPLTPFEWFQLKAHSLMCKNCLFFGRQIKALKNLLGGTNKGEHIYSSIASPLCDEARARIKSSLHKK